MSEAATPDAILAFIMEARSDDDPSNPALQVFAELTGTAPEDVLESLARGGESAALTGIRQTEPSPDMLRLTGAAKAAEKSSGNALIILDLPKKGSHTSSGSKNARAVRLLPQFVLAFEDADTSANAMTLRILAHDKWDSPMCALSLEDAVRLEGLSAQSQTDLPERNGIFPEMKGLYPMPPGTGAVLQVRAAPGAADPARIAKILRRSAAILLRRLDIARARAHESAELERALLDGA